MDDNLLLLNKFKCTLLFDRLSPHCEPTELLVEFTFETFLLFEISCFTVYIFPFFLSCFGFLYFSYNLGFDSFYLIYLFWWKTK